MNEVKELIVPEDWHDVMWDFIVRVQKFVPGRIDWIARQMSNHEWTNDWAFVIGKRVGCIDIDRARGADESVVREIATEMLGYPPDSKPDLERRAAEAKTELDEIDRQLTDLRNQRGHWQNTLDMIESRLKEAE